MFFCFGGCRACSGLIDAQQQNSLLEPDSFEAGSRPHIRPRHGVERRPRKRLEALVPRTRSCLSAGFSVGCSRTIPVEDCLDNYSSRCIPLRRFIANQPTVRQFRWEAAFGTDRRAPFLGGTHGRIIDLSFDGRPERSRSGTNMFQGLILGVLCALFRAGPVWRCPGAEFC